MEAATYPNTLPTHDALMNPVLRTLHELGGSASISEIDDKVAEIVGLTEDQLRVPHGGRPNRSEIQYRLAWTRTYLKLYGLLDNSTRGVWSLTAKGQQVTEVDGRDVVRTVTALSRKPQVTVDTAEAAESPEPDIEQDWRGVLSDTLLKMAPAAFERLAQRLLREAGFEVTGRSGDGGIDGTGILRIGLLSFHVIFQCKRWQGVVGPATVREFRGAMMGRADKGLVITTGTFTRDAIKEATRDGAPAIDLVDGEQLIDMLKNLQLGVTTRQVEQILVDIDWFSAI
jgi:restriction system protein